MMVSYGVTQWNFNTNVTTNSFNRIRYNSLVISSLNDYFLPLLPLFTPQG
ncbi:hypothetical protein Premu_1817 [Hallella multisaccharivorax DSM 17128]|uniref:Uncharacterized protein n=1 Tax=Hallella multisaccharivorax DSM 17128 TaxID=688246 RepID=F8N6B7_9BACT|nr:hypothetical protein Premu_1817 [Hallella multisaccharivorax DSM 17128]